MPIINAGGCVVAVGLHTLRVSVVFVRVHTPSAPWLRGGALLSVVVLAAPDLAHRLG